ncbi:unnamed protein product, partial [Staurois parvus]
MRRCFGGPCSTYLVLRSHAMCPLQRPRPSPPADAGIRLLCPVPVTSGRTGAAGGGKFKKFKKCLFFFFFNFQYALSCALPAFCLFFL